MTATKPKSAQPDGEPAEQAGVDKSYAEPTAQLFADEYAKLVHFMVFTAAAADRATAISGLAASDRDPTS